jgi:DNA/RNA-binding domain of Phe-tRNA-synthetase-like protein
MRFGHATAVRDRFPTLVAGVISLEGVDASPPADRAVGPLVAAHLSAARQRLGTGSEADLPEVQAWRRVFSAMGLKPTQYRCASEALLRRLRRDGDLPALHPLVDLCNAVSARFAIPVAAFDLDRVDGDLTVGPASGAEDYLSFSNEHEHPAHGEVIYTDSAGNAHSRRWTNRQSRLSAITTSTTRALIVAEAVHDGAASDIPHLVELLRDQLAATWPATPTAAVLDAGTSSRELSQ